MNVCLSDLAITVPAYRHYNLLDDRHFSYNLEQLEKSAKDGSLFRKSDKIKVRKVPPPEEIKAGKITLSREPLFMTQNPLLSQVKIVEPKFEELDISETQFIDDFTDFTEDDEE
jgi:hypothetical protein